jgi:hypothetical protein
MGFDPGPSMQANLSWQLRPNGGNRLANANCLEQASMAWSLKRLGWLDSELRALISAAAQRRAISRVGFEIHLNNSIII